MAERRRAFRPLAGVLAASAALALGVALKAGHGSAAGPAAAAVPGPAAPAAQQAPALPAPQWVGANPRGGKVVLSWIRDPRFASVRVYRAAADATGVFVPIGSAVENSYADATVVPGNSYRYRLAAVGADGREGRASAELGVRVPVATSTPPAPPRWEGHLSVEEGVGLKWVDQPGADIVAYNVYRRTPPDTEFRLLGSVRGTSFVDTGAVAGSELVYALSALDSSFRETPFSAELAVTHRPPREAAVEKEKKAAPRWAPRRTRLVALVTRADQGLLRPADVAVGPVSGNVYLSDSGRNAVFVFDGKGAYLRTVTGAAGPEGAFRRLLGIALDRDETLYAVDAGQGAVFAFAGGGGGGRRVELKLPAGRHPAALVDCAAVGGGRLTLVDNANNRLLALEQTGQAAVVGAAGFRPGEFSAPTFGAQDAAGNLYIADTLNARVQVLSPAGEALRVFGRPEGSASLLGRPKGIAVRANGEVLVADSWLNAVQVYDAQGAPLAVLVDEEGLPLDLGSPNGIALGPGDRLYIAERLSGRLQIREFVDAGK